MKLLTLMQAKEFLTSWFREFQIPGFLDVITYSMPMGRMGISVNYMEEKLRPSEVSMLQFNMESLFPGSVIERSPNSMSTGVHISAHYAERNFSILHIPQSNLIRHSRKVNYVVLVQYVERYKSYYGFRYVRTFEEAIWKCRPESVSKVGLKPLRYSPREKFAREDGGKVILSWNPALQIPIFLDMTPEQSEIFLNYNIEKNPKF